MTRLDLSGVILKGKQGCDVLNAGSATATRQPDTWQRWDGGDENAVFRSPLLIASNTFTATDRLSVTKCLKNLEQPRSGECVGYYTSSRS